MIMINLEECGESEGGLPYSVPVPIDADDVYGVLYPAGVRPHSEDGEEDEPTAEDPDMLPPVLLQE